MIFDPNVPLWLRRQEEGALDGSQLATLDRLFDGILPADHARQIPSAREARASRFVSRLLAMDPSVYVEIPSWKALYPRALVALDGYATQKYGKAVAGLDDASLIELLVGLESGALPGLPADLDQKVVFTTLRRHCIQGCFADPRWGGNEDKVMWRAMGYLQPAEDLFHE